MVDGTKEQVEIFMAGFLEVFYGDAVFTNFLGADVRIIPIRQTRCCYRDFSTA